MGSRSLGLATSVLLLAIACAGSLTALASCSTSSGEPGAAGASDAARGTTSPGAEDATESPGQDPTVAPVELATGLSGACMAADEEAVYVCVKAEIRKIPIDGGAAETLWKAPSGELIAHLTLAEGRLFATTDARLHAVGTDGTGGKDLHKGSKLHRALAFSSGSAFVLDANAIVSVPAAGGSPKKATYDFPTSLTSAGDYVWLVEGDTSSDSYDITVLRASTLASAAAFFLGNSGASGAKPRPDRMASDGPRLYLGAAKAVSNRVEIEEYDNPPVPSGSTIASRHLGDIDAYAVNDIAADEKGLFVATNDAIYRYDREGSKFVSLAKGAPSEHIALNQAYVFWLDGETLRGTPR